MEIKASDLMLNNWLQCKGKNFQVDVQTMRTVLAFKNDIEPIPLTPEILLKAGFERDYNPEKNHRVEFWNNGVCRLEVYDGRIIFVHGETDTKYIHELQNLYHALTSTELKIKL